MNYQIINTCGTSTLTNRAKGSEIASDLIKFSNVKSETDIPAEIYKTIEVFWDNLINDFKVQDEEHAKDASAELNTLLTWQRKNNVRNEDCYCYLVHTDTVFGYMAAALVEEWLKNHKYQGVEVHKIEPLNTKSLDSFEDGLSNFAKWAFEISNNFYGEIIFNIAGGFKSVSGFAQILGTFLADKTIYKFEGNKDVNEVLEIPKLPINLSVTDAIKDNFNDYRRVSLDIKLSSYSHLNPLWVKNGKLTPWGRLVWENAKRELYSKEVFPFLYDKIIEGKDFRKSVKDLDNNRIWHINERIDDLCIYALSNGLKNPNRLNYKTVKGETKKYFSHECDAWADQDAKRLFCNEKDGKIIVEKLDKALH